MSRAGSVIVPDRLEWCNLRCRHARDISVQSIEGVMKVMKSNRVDCLINRWDRLGAVERQAQQQIESRARRLTTVDWGV